ncbi:unnamed protein product [Protopolystoma xenopodis]|uniref:Uncharacterized protein n=1 Tax=Protopolystoma xenopodis TaxID=117903 RepID=A0A3S5A932_9PLAT|nr:unnamed protein product [Protopolystoma xenopodis]
MRVGVLRCSLSTCHFVRGSCVSLMMLFFCSSPRPTPKPLQLIRHDSSPLATVARREPRFLLPGQLGLPCPLGPPKLPEPPAPLLPRVSSPRRRGSVAVKRPPIGRSGARARQTQAGRRPESSPAPIGQLADQMPLLRVPPVRQAQPPQKDDRDWLAQACQFFVYQPRLPSPDVGLLRHRAVWEAVASGAPGRLIRLPLPTDPDPGLDLGPGPGRGFLSGDEVDVSRGRPRARSLSSHADTVLSDGVSPAASSPLAASKSTISRPIHEAEVNCQAADLVAGRPGTPVCPCPVGQAAPTLEQATMAVEQREIGIQFDAIDGVQLKPTLFGGFRISEGVFIRGGLQFPPRLRLITSSSGVDMSSLYAEPPEFEFKYRQGC